MLSHNFSTYDCYQIRNYLAKKNIYIINSRI